MANYIFISRYNHLNPCPRAIQLCMREKPMGENGSAVDPMVAATERMKLYVAAHPGSPSAIRHPRLFVREQLWIALLGPNAEEGIIGIGTTVEAALRDFDAQYLARPEIPRNGA